MSTQKYFDSWIQYVDRLLYYSSEQLVDRSKYRLIYSQSIDFASTFTPAQIFSRELPLGSGYARANPIWDGTQSFDSVLQQDGLTEVVVESEAIGGNIVYRTAVLIANADPSIGVPVSAISGNIITTNTAHGRTQNQEIMLTTDGPQPGGTSGTALYYADVVDVDELRLLVTSGGSVVAITSPGSGNRFLRFCQGRPVWFRTEDASVTIADGQTAKYRIRQYVRGA